MAGGHIPLGNSLPRDKGERVVQFDNRFTYPFAGLPESTFFVTTGIHGAHVLAGLLLILYVTPESIRRRVLGQELWNSRESEPLLVLRE